MKVFRFFCAMLAFFQVVAISAGLKPYDKTVNYGGTPYVEPVITQYLTLIENGSSNYTIITGENASPAEKTAATELQSFLQKISGVTLPIAVDTSVRSSSRKIIVGKTNREPALFSIDREALGEEGFVLKTVGSSVVIAGGEQRGTLYGVYAFLEEQLGYRRYTPKCEYIPSLSTVRINALLNDRQLPSFEVRRCSSAGSDARYFAKKRINTAFWTGNADFGDALTFVLFDVTLPTLVPDSLFAEHPDYFAYRKDLEARTTDHVCLSNEEALAIAVNNARTAILSNTRNSNHLHIGQKDNMIYCECEKCTALYEKYGTVAAPTIIFTNELARALESEFPDMYFTFYSYNETRRPPKDLTLKCRDNVVPVLCGLHQACRSHPLTECGTEDGVEGMTYLFTDHEPTIAQDFVNWTKVANRTYIYDYTINFLNTAQFFSNLGTMQQTIKYMHDIGITGYVYTCGDEHQAAFNELRNYLITKLHWNVNADVNYHMTDFLRGYYGAAAEPYIREIIDLQTAKIAATAHAFDFDWHYQSGFYSLSEIDKLDSLWSMALKTASDPEQLARIETAQLSWRYYKANLCIKEYSFFNLNRKGEIEKLYDDFKLHGIKSISSFGSIPEKETLNFNNRPLTWR